jgi:hypothetical protein
MPFASAAATTATHAASHSVLGHYFASLMGYTGFLVLLGITLIWLIKKHPHKIAWLFPSLKQKLLADAQAAASTLPTTSPLPPPIPAWGASNSSAPLNPALLHIEASVTLEAGQTLHVVQAQGQRLLVSSGVAGVQVLTQLSNQQPALEALTQATTPSAPPKAEAPPPPVRNPLVNPTHYPTPPLPLGTRPPAPAPSAQSTAPPHPSRAFFETLRQAIPPQHLSVSAASAYQREIPRG